jgi:ferric-dicitrate binding protein FerR (iron transport regulator)
MNNDLLNILSNSNKDIDNQKLMDYLSGKLSEQEKHEVERWMADNDFTDDAMEGLQTLSGTGKKDLTLYVDQLNKELNQYIQQKKQRRERRRIKDNPWIYLALFLILLLVIMGYVVIKMLQHK